MIRKPDAIDALLAMAHPRRGCMSDTSEQARVQAKKKQFKLLMTRVFVVAGPLLGAKIFSKEFAGLGGAGQYFFYIATPLVFAGLFLFYLFL